MKPGNLSSGQRFWRSASILTIITLSIYIGSCVGKSDKQAKTFGPPSCVTLTHTDIQTNWVDKGFTDPLSANYIYYLQFYTSYLGPGTDFKVVVRGLKNDYTEITGSEIELSPGATCLVAFPGDVAIGTNSTELGTLNILEADGKLKSQFDFIKLTPQKDPKHTEFMNFTVEVKSKDGSTEQSKVTLPCPPCYYCRPPCDTTIVDSTSEKIALPSTK